MKPSPVLIAALAAFLPASLLAQKAGDAVSPAALAKLDWIRGEAPTEWEPGKVYVLECWATWCAPCVAAIPHVDELYDRYREKGLRVFGINVWENGRDKVSAFVEKKGDGMSYPVAYTGKGGAFETEWLKPGGVTGIPAAFVVKDGRVLAKTHPARLTEEMIEAFLEGGEAEKSARDSILEAERRKVAAGKASRALTQAMASKDKAEIKARLEDLEKVDPDSDSLPAMRIMAHAASGEWDAATAAYGDLPAGNGREMVAFNLFMVPDRTDGAPAKFMGLVADDYEAVLGRTPGNNGWVKLASIRWDLGQKEQAIAAAKRALEVVEGKDPVRGIYPESACRKLIGSLEQGVMPDRETLRLWFTGKE